MKPILMIPALLGSTVTLGGCIPMMALSAAQMVAKSARGTPVSNAALKPQAESACSAQAAQYGVVHVIDVTQPKINTIIVWGTAGEGAQKQSFECHFGTRITAFKLRPIAPMK
ncbi:MAG: hypothetical protein ABIS38_02240 [Sphingomicrobium sp.]